MAEIYRASTTAPVNIAVIKYWGKRDAKLNLPTNSSLSVTLSQDDLRTHTTASCSAIYTTDSLLLNGKDQDISGARTQACLRELRSLRTRLENANPGLPKLADLKLKIVSENNFPTAAGLASSAAGFAALVRAIANLYELDSSPTELSRIARQGSGSACRSLFGGYVAWEMGSQADGSDSLAVQVAPVSHWPEMRAIILVASDKQKDVGSTAGMQQTVATSTFMKQRVLDVPTRMEEMNKAIQEKDFQAFARLTMKDSNSFHATCLDTEPPIKYMNETSWAAIRIVEAINAAAGKLVAAYTFDAGPNAVIYHLEEDAPKVTGVLKSVIGDKEGWQGARGSEIQAQDAGLLPPVAVQTLKDGVSRVILTGVGGDPVKIDDHLIDASGNAIVR
ncbi:diphosphomevalonate decarboxylase [Verruconis gallopava]|uniref:Diphosphomevalonate decarboxylase n=1 Tax=Verruconis gallopava TaxID=253628 RepID=A0A0D2AFU4_9PEZI|nr:diphosphomevalonate decarboxylase [Verruconis gallopava]KIW05370.1 diphosphomevalonate decarboxylase [Verruconis gallopava]